jgi:hypothetical protein
MKTSTVLTNQQKLIDWATGSGRALEKDQRLQVKIPSALTHELDRLFPNQDRSEVLTQLALQAVVQQLRFADRPELAELVTQEQSAADEMWNYLEKRDAGL